MASLVAKALCDRGRSPGRASAHERRFVGCGGDDAGSPKPVFAEAVADEIRAHGVPDDIASRFWEVVRENAATRAEVADWWAVFRDGASPIIAEEDRDFVAEAVALLPSHPYDGDTWSTWTSAVKEATGRKGKSLFMPLRHAITGRTRGPEMADVMPLLQTPPKC